MGEISSLETFYFSLTCNIKQIDDSKFYAETFTRSFSIIVFTPRGFHKVFKDIAWWYEKVFHMMLTSAEKFYLFRLNVPFWFND